MPTLSSRVLQQVTPRPLLALLGAALITGYVLIAALPVRAAHASYFPLSYVGGTFYGGGTTEIGLQGVDDGTVAVALPFDVEFYGTTYAAGTNIVVSSNGNIQFTGNQSDYPDDGDCLPEDDFGATIFALTADLDAAGAAEGVFTQVYNSGDPGNRWFVIEWRTAFHDAPDQSANFEIILWENTDLFSVVYGTIETPPDGERAIAGVQSAADGRFTEYFCTADLDTMVPEMSTEVDYVLGVMEFSAATYAVSEDGGTATITVNRTGTTEGEVSVQYETSAGSATAGADYTDVSGTLTFGDGVASQTFTVPIMEDSANESDETVNLTLFGPAEGATLGGQRTAVLTITDAAPGATAAPSASAAPGAATPAPTTAPAGRIPNTATSAEVVPTGTLALTGLVLAVSVGGVAVMTVRRRTER